MELVSINKTESTQNMNAKISSSYEIETILLNRLAIVGQRSLAEYKKISEATVSRWKSDGYFKDIADFLAFFNLQIAPPDAVIVSKDYLSSVEVLVDIGLKAERRAKMH